ncbi:MAG: PAS domain S-box protein [Kiritimatiellae bacterium]|nr:PAS domain S-box protein [Kiritimatiellia bacterium]
MKTGFIDKLLERLDKLDPKSLQTHFLHLVQERGLLETIFQSIQEGVVVISESGKLTYANKAAEQLMGFSLESAKGRPASKYMRDVNWAEILEIDASKHSCKMMSREIEITYPEHRFVNFYIVPLLEDKNAENAVVAILRDVTHDRENESSLLESERLNAVKLLAAGVAHEIGNPLNALNIHLQLLDREIKDLPTPESKPFIPNDKQTETDNDWQDRVQSLNELIEIAGNEVSRLDLIITQFLRAIRPSSPSLALSRIETIIKETLSLLKQEVQNRNIDIELDCSKTVPKIPVDRDQIKQAFFNIIRNSFQAMPDGGSLKISLSSNDQYLVISFQDNGEGIRPEDFGHIFEPYHTTKTSGSGLGLMIVQRIIQDHGGQIEVVSDPGIGTSFTIQLPLAERRMRLLKAHKQQKTQKTGTGKRKHEQSTR